MEKSLKGIFVPVVTPFHNQRVDYYKLAHNIDKANHTPLKGYMPLGSNGEFAHLSEEEQLQVVKTVKDHAAQEKVLIVGISRQSVYNTIEFGKKVQDLGADYVFALTPSYFASAMTDDALIRYYTQVAEGLSIPLIMYNCPKFAAGVTLSAKVVKTLSKHPNIVAMKDTSHGNIREYLAVKDSSFEVLAGSITNFMEGLKAGAAGGVLSMANYLPEPCCQIQELYESGRVDEAQALSDKLVELNKKSAGRFGVAGVKAACDLFGYQGGEVRSPLLDCTLEQIEMLARVFKEAGYMRGA